MKRVEKSFMALGLTPLEAKVYITLFAHKKVKVTELGKAAKVTRTQLYPILEKLIEKGLIVKVKNGPAVYSPIEPEKMITILNKWLREHTKLVRDAERMLRRMKGNAGMRSV